MLGDAALHEATERAQAASPDDDRVEVTGLSDRLRSSCRGRRRATATWLTGRAGSASRWLTSSAFAWSFGVVPDVDRKAAAAPRRDAHDTQLSPERLGQFGASFERPMRRLVAVIGDQDLSSLVLLPCLVGRRVEHDGWA